ncbi:HAD family hydrolase [Mucilaginibacter sp. cycad4]|uniref:HAD family hydrolase n=1 Tax=Mucilaginibacter sp. cycad4 TaxID=3342096 RepID=UPI002AAB0624|nr:HAD family hydrolase [Mucilaginibacter gossypii]WPU98456.1 HAD family hydrolase [Mucilaginibacter gossypii]
MQIYQHYSFDLWLTLIKSNPYFKIERTKIFHRDFNPTAKSIDEVARAFRQVDLMCNAVNERTGKNIDADEMYLMVIGMINDNQYPLADIDIDRLYADMEKLLFYYLPVVYSPVTIEVLQHLKQKGDCSLSILSNTGFIKGQTLRKVVVKLGLDTFFNFQIYSDEEGMSKPNGDLFKLMVQKVKECNEPKQIAPSGIIHIGDNPAADIAGANDAGLNSLLINSNNLSILTLLSL